MKALWLTVGALYALKVSKVLASPLKPSSEALSGFKPFSHAGNGFSKNFSARRTSKSPLQDVQFIQPRSRASMLWLKSPRALNVRIINLL